MFAGIIEHVGTVVGAEPTPRRQGGGLAHRLEIDLGPLLEGLRLGASVAVNGVCLTLAARADPIGGFDVVPETWRRSSLRRLARGSRVNLERSLQVGDRIDGHFVQGHVEAVGRLERIERGGGEWKLRVAAGAELLPFITPKGSIALDGVSLTVVDVAAEGFSVALIPTTLDQTTLGDRQPGDELNIETDILARIVLARLGALAGAAPATERAPGLDWDKLRAGGFV